MMKVIFECVEENSENLENWYGWGGRKLEEAGQGLAGR